MWKFIYEKFISVCSKASPNSFSRYIQIYLIDNRMISVTVLIHVSSLNTPFLKRTFDTAPVSLKMFCIHGTTANFIRTMCMSFIKYSINLSGTSLVFSQKTYKFKFLWHLILQSCHILVKRTVSKNYLAIVCINLYLHWNLS